MGCVHARVLLARSHALERCRRRAICRLGALAGAPGSDRRRTRRSAPSTGTRGMHRSSGTRARRCAEPLGPHPRRQHVRRAPLRGVVTLLNGVLARAASCPLQSLPDDDKALLPSAGRARRAATPCALRGSRRRGGPTRRPPELHVDFRAPERWRVSCWQSFSAAAAPARQTSSSSPWAHARRDWRMGVGAPRAMHHKHRRRPLASSSVAREILSPPVRRRREALPSAAGGQRPLPREPGAELAEEPRAARPVGAGRRRPSRRVAEGVARRAPPYRRGRTPLARFGSHGVDGAAPRAPLRRPYAALICTSTCSPPCSAGRRRATREDL